ncbi:DUF6239 family natural product biosynthesis protein [Saccharothrix longispora]|uniref:DUF6239 family natural product biosynthesis protein n=1 Tax=Saccharothrix longispora TaxID=33920 RepID=UPI0028FD5C93|nr:DUF6239 family natural product biosynthesis protein [Saccharothrix longispora]MDU0289343.1 DUF6239 family natural product biosynthesis protein [Saccharothrix longispora]
MPDEPGHVVPTALLAQGGGHDHVLSVGVSIGPLLLRLVLLATVSFVVGFGLLRGFLAEPDRRSLIGVIACAGGAAVMVLLLSGGLNVSERLVPLLLLLLALPLYLVLSRDPRFAAAVGAARRFAPWVFWPVAVLAVDQFARAWLSGAVERAEILLHTGSALALVAMSWFAVSRTRRTAVAVGTRIGAAALSMVLIWGAAQTMLLHSARPAEATGRAGVGFTAPAR